MTAEGFDRSCGFIERFAMPLQPSFAAAIDATVDREAPGLEELALKIHAHPELRFEEHQAAAWICEYLRARGHHVDVGLGGMATSFVCRAGKAGGARVAILAEYDALPEIGHACGHNLIAAGAVGAFIAAADIASRNGGEVILVGTPAEEGGGGKIKLLEAGVFDGLDAAMMFHPFDRDLLAHPALANVWITFKFKGTPSHAAASPHEGHSALTACMDTFRLIDGQRVHFRDGVRVHGFINDGGQAVNIIPEHAGCEISVRARTGDELARVREIVERCGRAAAMASNVDVEVGARMGYRDMVNNMTLARRFGTHLAELGRVPREGDARVGSGSTDMGDISHAVPSIHPYLAVVNEGETLIHNRAFTAAAGSPRGIETALVASKAMGKTAIEVLCDPALREEIRAEWSAR